MIRVFFDGVRDGLAGASVHMLDIGGAYPGLAIDLVDNWSEGNIYRAVKLSEKGVRQERLWKHILENTRTPTHNKGDIEAMIAACELARRRYVELLGRVRDITLGAFDHQDFPFDQLVAALETDRDTSRQPLFQALFVSMAGIDLDLAGSSRRVRLHGGRAAAVTRPSRT